ncbi:MAG: HPr(Ser) kinase/phosphatase [Candidatus Nanopelagicales bacterium]|nr:HPr(Ser) kinase/phosphatase [Candidatus Nanopelagicales bacterium]
MPLSVITQRLGALRVAGGHLDLDTIHVTTAEVNRPGLQLTGYLEHFAHDRLQIIGWTETAYLSGLDPQVRERRLDDYFALGFPGLVVARGLHVMPDMVHAADRHDVPVFATDVLTSEFASAFTWQMVHALAPRTVIVASLVDVYGEGVLLVGDPDIGKSETALELVRRGHRLIAAHHVEVRRVSQVHLRGGAPEGQRHAIDIPGVGVVDVEELFGMGAIKPDARVTLVVSLEARDPAKEYERVGMADRAAPVFGVDVTHVTIPVQPGRNLAVIIEAAALNHRMRGLGYNAARDLLSGGASGATRSGTGPSPG